MNNLAVWKHLIVRDMRVLKAAFYNSFLGGVIFLTVAYIIYGLLMPAMGFKPSMIAPLFWGMLVLVMTQESYDCARVLATDIALNPMLRFYSTLPLGFSWLLARYVVSNSLQLVLNSILLFFGGELLIGQQLHSSLFKIVMFWCTYFVLVLFFATFALAIGTVASLAWFRDNMWSRVFIPFIFGGCLYVSWYGTYAVTPLFSFLFLASPLTYAAEGTRAIVLGAEGYLPLSLCLTVMLCLSILNIFLFRRWFIQRIDPVMENV